MKRIALFSLLGLFALDNANAQFVYQGPRIERSNSFNSKGPIDANGKLGVSRTLSDIFADTINVRFKGAYCDGNSHPLSASFTSLTAAQAVFGAAAVSLTQESDSAAINAAFIEVGADSYNLQAVGADSSVNNSAKIVFGSGSCVIGSTPILANEIKSRAVVVDFTGTSIVAATNGKPALDLTGSVGVTLIAPTIVGSNTAPPSTAILLSTANNSSPSNYITISQPSISGYFTKAAMTVNGVENVTVNQGYFENTQSNAIAGVVLDGLTHNQICSASDTCPTQDVIQSFNNFDCLQ